MDDKIEELTQHHEDNISLLRDRLTNQNKVINALETFIANLPKDIIHQTICQLKKKDQLDKLTSLSGFKYLSHSRYIFCASLSRDKQLDSHLFKLLDYIDSKVKDNGKIEYGDDYIKIEYNGWWRVTMEYEKGANGWSLKHFSAFKIDGTGSTTIIAKNGELFKTSGWEKFETTSIPLVYYKEVKSLIAEIMDYIKQY